MKIAQEKKILKCFFALLFTCLVLSSENSSAQKFYSSGFNPREISQIGYLKPFSFIQLVETGNKGKLNDSISHLTADTVLNVIENSKTGLPFTTYLSETDSLMNKKILREFEWIIGKAFSKNKDAIVLPKTIDSLFSARNIRFGSLTVITGFTRIKGNLGNQIGKGIATGILSLGMYTQSPIKAVSTIYTAIIDTENQVVLFVNKSSQQSEPLDKTKLDKQFNDLFQKYLKN